MGGLRTQTTVLALGLTLLLAVHGLKFENNAYTDLLIAIHSDVPENSTIIDQLRQMVEDASPYLYWATKRKAYLGQVTILVPSTWTAGSYSSSSDSSLTFTEADVRVDVANPRQMVDAPYVFQPEQCGQPGRYIHLTPGFLTTVPGNYGNKGRVFVHEFAHYRYGVFDEHGDGDLYPYTFVNDQNKRTATGCTKTGFAGRFIRRNDTSQQCLVTDNVDQDCFFIINSTTSTAEASIMYAQDVNSVFSFCETTFDESKRHYPTAKNQHNAMCRDTSSGRPLSTWDVIKEHSDMNSLPLTSGTPPMAPDIRVVRPGDNSTCGRRLVLVLDVSESMVDQDRWFKQNQIGDKLIRDIVPVGSELGIVVFNTDVNVKQELTLLDEEGRANMAKNLPAALDFWGFTAIGDALREAKEMLTEEGQSGRGSRILLITDGVLTRGRTIAEVVPEIQAAGITVHTIAYGKDADGSLAALSKTTGGQYAFYSEDGSSNLDSIIEPLWSDLSLCQRPDQVTVHQETMSINPGSVKTGTVSIDGDIGQDTEFTFTYSRGGQLEVELTSPSGTVFNKDSPGYFSNTPLSIIRIVIPDVAEAGQWVYRLQDLSSSSASEVSVTVKSESRTSDPPIAIESWVGDTTLTKNVQYIYVYVHKGYAPVLGADVTARVKLPSGNVTTHHAVDNGLAPDVKKGDGVYTVAMPKNAIGNGRVSVSASANTANAFIPVGNGTGTGAIPVVPVPLESTEMRPAGDVTRVTSGGAFDVTNATSSPSDVSEASDEVAPSAVSDLAANTDLSTRTVTLTWTSPGDDLSLGTASHYDMRMANSSSQLQDDFNSARKVLDAMLTSGSLVPLPAGTDHVISVSVPEDWSYSVAVFAVKAVDEANNTGFLSNVAVASLSPPTFNPIVTAPPPVETSTSGENSSLPASTSSSLPASTSSSLPGSTTSSLPASTTSSLPASTTSSLPASTTSSLPASTTTSLPASTTSSLPATTRSIPTSSSSIPAPSPGTKGALPGSKGESKVPEIVGAVLGTFAGLIVLAVIAFVVHKVFLKRKRQPSPFHNSHLCPSATGSYEVFQQEGRRRRSDVSLGAINMSTAEPNGAPPASSSVYPKIAEHQAWSEPSKDFP